MTRRTAGFTRVLLYMLVTGLMAGSAAAATFQVNSTQDNADVVPGDGACYAGFTLPPLFTPACTLRAAIQEANALGGGDTIAFASSRLVPNGSGVVAFTPATALPAIASPITLDGTTHTAYATTDPWAVPIIHIEGTFSSGDTGLVVSTSGTGSAIRGIAIVNFPRYAIGTSGSNVTIQGCHIGVHHGVGLAGNGVGIVSLSVATNVTIGRRCGDVFGCSGRGNLISANSGHGLFIAGFGHVIAGNRIGTNLAGTATTGFGNGEWGVRVIGTNSVIGDVGGFFTGSSTVPIAAGNLISGNVSGGIYLSGGSNEAYANQIGTDVTGTSALPNFGLGVLLEDNANTIGEAGVGGNLISGNDSTGIRVGTFGVRPSSGNLIQYNRIGVDASGSMALGNVGSGIHVADGTGNDIVGNVISGNFLNGVLVHTPMNGIEQNRIGTNDQGDDLGNGADGVRVAQGAQRNRIGATVLDADQDIPGLANEIAFNAGSAIVVVAVNGASYRNAFRGNSLHENGGPGIDLGDDGPTANDPTDSDRGPNNLINYPEIDATNTQLNTSTGDVEVRYRVDALLSSATYPLTIDFYLSLDGEEGEVWLGSDTYSSIVAGL